MRGLYRGRGDRWPISHTLASLESSRRSLGGGVGVGWPFGEQRKQPFGICSAAAFAAATARGAHIYIYAGRLRDQLRRLVMSAVRSGQGHTNSATRRSCGDDHRPGRSRRDDDISSVGESGCAREGGSAQLRARSQLIAQTRRAQYVAPYSARPVPS